MNFWYSGEVDSEVYDAYVTTRRLVESRLNDALSKRAYGTAVTKIAILPIILGPHFSDRAERKLVQRTKCSADYRLRIDFEAFLNGDANVREQLLIRNTIQAIADISRKARAAKLDFDGESLAIDVLSLFSLAQNNLEGVRPK